MPGALHICVYFQGGARQFERRLKRRENRQRSKEGEKEKAVRERTKPASAVVCCLFTVTSLLSFLQRERHADDSEVDKEAADVECRYTHQQTHDFGICS